MLDGPYTNASWNGREIAVIEADCTERPVTRTLKQTLSAEALGSLTGKHAIYLVVEGPEVEQPQQPQSGRFGNRPPQPQRPKGLFTLHGIGFTRGESANWVPQVPQVTITADGQRLNSPAEPIRSSNANGLVDARTYQVYAPLKSNSKVEATATLKNGQKADVKIVVSPITEGRATVKATYNGQQKVFLIN